MATTKSRRSPADERSDLTATDREPGLAPYERLKQAILKGEFAPGQQLVEVTLAKLCGVSRTPVREALQRLEQDGLVYRDSHGGVSVRERSPEEILDLYETRIVLEVAAARVAAERRTEHDVRVLQWSAERGKEVPAGDANGMVDANQQFHSAVWHATHNESLTDLLERLNLHLARYPGTTLVSPGRWERAVAEHEEMTDAIARRDGAAAEDVARRHFTEAREIRLALFAQERTTSAK